MARILWLHLDYKLVLTNNVYWKKINELKWHINGAFRRLFIKKI